MEHYLILIQQLEQQQFVSIQKKGRQEIAYDIKIIRRIESTKCVEIYLHPKQGCANRLTVSRVNCAIHVDAIFELHRFVWLLLAL